LLLRTEPVLVFGFLLLLWILLWLLLLLALRLVPPSSSLILLLILALFPSSLLVLLLLGLSLALATAPLLLGSQSFSCRRRLLLLIPSSSTFFRPFGNMSSLSLRLRSLGGRGLFWHVVRHLGLFPLVASPTTATALSSSSSAAARLGSRTATAALDTHATDLVRQLVDVVSSGSVVVLLILAATPTSLLAAAATAAAGMLVLVSISISISSFPTFLPRGSLSGRLVMLDVRALLRPVSGISALIVAVSLATLSLSYLTLALSTCSLVLPPSPAPSKLLFSLGLSHATSVVFLGPVLGGPRRRGRLRVG
jgi:hypothetical protein